MSIKVMIIDGHADFRRLLTHHVNTHWPDSVITEFDPIESGNLPDSFSGAGNDVVLIGDQQGDRDALHTLKLFSKTPGFPPVVYFAADESAREAAERCKVAAFFVRDQIRHKALIVRLGDILRAQRRTSTTDSLFVGDMGTGISPLIKGYRFIRKLSATSHSAVYLAQRQQDDLKVVLKVLQQVPDLAEGIGAFDRFLQEYELIADLHHPNIVKILDLGVSDDHAHIAMEYLGGGDLRQKIEAGIRTADAVSYLRQISGALAKVHSVGITHRDLKPGNIMLRVDGSIALIDFGLAKRMRLRQEITDSGEIFGTPYYMSPEQGRGNDVDARSDIYSLGVIFYEMLTGQKPYTASNAMGIIYKHSEAPVPLLPHRLAVHQALLNMLLAKRPEDRLQTAAEIGEWL
ncbi:MAG TPA: serine/threonine-protein kinase [Woeseiaceae bacterium]|nr:serine/threonine-protein kinase [Woeseiaceae bacterium]